MDGAKVISGSTRIVDPDKGGMIFLYLANCYGNDKKDYTDKPDPKNQHSLENASQCKSLVKLFKMAEQNSYNILQDGFHPSIAKAVHTLAFVSTPKCDQTTSRHGSVKKAVHCFLITPGVNQNPQEGCEAASVYHLVEGREQISHWGQGLYLAKDMVNTSSGATAVGAMYNATPNLKANIEAIIKVFFPTYYNVMKKTLVSLCLSQLENSPADTCTSPN
ncbi:hypothetical protein C8R45DRAFT_921115 [Mycena sanguinolenta]|nr:hypothetical protein C8R45DRAFT_921115 [Mycena sanguinolenta]